ncbi:preprotein translocase subunit YajC [Dorea sp. AM58-8]|uniref:preprotein translocase subunit YajC n=1 Tax=Dorea sp. AM58-8 TaxID=2292346 RepID=UPI000E4E6741|nr:preprotein translocase subunit YajC [Dorea sp. AM58-8]
MILIYAVIIGVFWWFLMRPQKKEQKRLAQLLSELEVGDTVLTTSGFYGVIIDITDDDVIVEFGSNKNCRIPMQKSAIVQVEKPDAE